MSEKCNNLYLVKNILFGATVMRGEDVIDNHKHLTDHKSVNK